MKNRSLLFSAAVLAASLPQARAANITWDGGVGGLGTDLGTAVNWAGDVLPSTAAPDTAVFDGTAPGPLSLVYGNAVFAGASGNAGIGVSLAATQLASVSIDTGANTNAIRVSDITLALGSGAFTLGNGAGTFNLRLGGAAGTRTFTNNSLNTATVNSDIVFLSGGNAAQTLALAGSGNWTFNNTLANETGTLALTKSGTGAATLNGLLTYTAGTTVNGGTLNINSGTSSMGAGAFSLSGTAASVLNFAAAGTITTTGQFNTNSGGTNATVVNHSQGILSTGDMFLGNSAGSYSAYVMGGGTLNATNLRIGSAAANAAGSTGYFMQTGGTVNVPAGGLVTVSRGTNTTGVILVAGANAVFNAGGNNLNLGFSAGSTGVLTVTSGLVTENLSIITGQNLSTGIVNLNGGTVRTNSFTNFNGTGIVNFNGGTLQAFANNAAFLTMTGNATANVYQGGAVIDTNGKNVTIGQALLTAGGTTGVASVAVLSGGANYTAPPVVVISGGGGTGATAIANLTGGVVTSITVTSAGTGYTGTPAVTLVGGGGTTVATVGTGILGTNAADGGLAKNGAGALTIASNANTYTGPTNVNDGTLVLNGNISTSTLTTVGSGATLAGTGTSGALTIAAGGTFAPGNGIGTFNVQGDLTLGGTSAFEINPVGNLSDLAIATANLNFGGVLNVVNIGGTLVNGNTFNLFDWSGTSTGAFSTVNLPALDPSLSWDTGSLYTNGTISVVPEPDAAAAAGVLGTLLLLRRRRRK